MLGFLKQPMRFPTKRRKRGEPAQKSHGQRRMRRRAPPRLNRRAQGNQETNQKATDHIDGKRPPHSMDGKPLRTGLIHQVSADRPQGTANRYRENLGHRARPQKNEL